MIVLLLLLLQQRHLGVANGNSGGKDAVWQDARRCTRLHLMANDND